MKPFIFQLFICFSMIFNSFAGVTYLDEEPVVAARNPTWEESTPYTNSAGKVIGTLTPVDYDPFDYIPPPSTNVFGVTFPKLFSSDNRLIMTNATYSRRNGRILTFSQFGVHSLDLDITRVHFRILEYLKLSDMQSKIIAAETAQLEEQKRITGYNRIAAVPARTPQTQRATKIMIPHTAGFAFANTGGSHWIQKNIDGGEFIVLEDGSLWKIDPLDKIDASLWLAISDITVVESDDGSPGYDYLLINTDDDEKAHAKYMGQK